jgi:predicted NAD-dependent protein-ADP-ribosyltransferase YbiA (DUF1768 family)
MAPFPINYCGKEYRTSEALFQALRFGDETIREAIRGECSPMAAKMVAKRYIPHMVVAPRCEQDVANMLTVLRLKLQQHPQLQERLTKTTPCAIIEDCTTRQNESGLFWGAMALDGEWFGKNMLGQLWMQLREGAK